MIILYEIPVDDDKNEKVARPQFYIDTDHSLTKEELIETLSKMEAAERINIENRYDLDLFPKCIEYLRSKHYLDLDRDFPIVSEKRPSAEIPCLTMNGGCLNDEGGTDTRERLKVVLIQPYKFFV